MQYLPAHWASFGNNSLICVPGTLVAIGFSSPRIFSGAAGFKSQVSSCGGTPVKKRNRQRFARPKLAATARVCVGSPRERRPLRSEESHDEKGHECATSFPFTTRGPRSHAFSLATIGRSANSLAIT